MARRLSKPKHEAIYQDLVDLIRKYAADLTAEEMLAIAANVVGKIMAMQDQRTMTPARALEIVSRNIELGNQQVIVAISGARGSA